VTRERIYIETMQAVLTSTSKIMMDYRGAGNLLYLPLEKIMQNAGAPGAEGTAPRATPPEAPADAAPRSREALRNRERGER
jgi:membrane protease subunit HflK